MATIIFQLPFNGTAQGSGASASLTNGAFVGGRVNNQAVAFYGDGHAEVTQKLIPLNATYTLSFWVKVFQQVDGPSASWVLFKFASENQFLYLDLNSTLTRWAYIVIVQAEDRVSTYVNGRQTAVETIPADWGKPVGFCVVNDMSAKSGHLTLEDVTLYEGANVELPVPIPTPVPDLKVVYSVNGLNFQNVGVYVSDSNGLLDNLTLKEMPRYDWPDYHGEIVDLSRLRYQPRTISLSCFIQASDVDEFIEKLNLFLGQFTRSGTQRLRVLVHSTKPLVYEVYLRDAINLKKKWSDRDMVGTFELTLIEPEPIKRVLQFGAGTASITLTTSQVVSIHWGDQTHTYDVFGTNKTITHTYSTPGPHEIIVAGVIDEITSFSSNATVLWSKL